MTTLTMPMVPTDAQADQTMIVANDAQVQRIWISTTDGLSRRQYLPAPALEVQAVYLELTPEVVAAIEWGLDTYAADTEFLATH